MSAPLGDPGKLDRSVGRSAFGHDAAGYHSGRAGYAPELFDDLARLTRPRPRILEIGAGTGHASEGLLTLAPSSLTLLEPDNRLCNFLRKRFSSDVVEVVHGSFPEIEVTGPFDLLTCAAAFHWMEPAAALARAHDLLAADGVWAMWWNCYFGHGEPDPFGERVLEVLKHHRVRLPPSYEDGRHYALDAPRHIAQLERAGFVAARHTRYSDHRVIDAGKALDLYRTFSFIGELPVRRREQVMDDLETVIRTEFSGEITLCIVTSCYSAARQGASGSVRS